MLLGGSDAKRDALSVRWTHRLQSQVHRSERTDGRQGVRDFDQ
jgi:hypothetical protein